MHLANSLYYFIATTFLKHLTTDAGVYQMLDKDGVILYVGKARNLKRRLSSYFQRSHRDPKTSALMQHVDRIEVTITRENEALLLEHTLIKQHKPRYNIMFRDDKSYPYLHLVDQHDFPRLELYRGRRHEAGRYFGPYPSVVAVRETLRLLQRVFRLRQCKDGFFRHRTRSCLQYQIKRCSAPCVQLIDKETYAQDVRDVILFLEGKSQHVIDTLVKRMEASSRALDYEKAAQIRDQIANLRKVQAQQYVSNKKGDVDVIGLARQNNHVCVNVLRIRYGTVVGNATYFPRSSHDISGSDEDILMAFLTQYYVDPHRETDLPKQILVSCSLSESRWLGDALSELKGKRVSVSSRARLDRAKWLAMAMNNARQTLSTRLAALGKLEERLAALQLLLHLSSTPKRMECFDVSHTRGEATVASCVVFDGEKPNKQAYRRFNITDITPGDDYAAMRQAVSRRYLKLKEDEAKLPDILFIDGGKGQLTQAEIVLEELQVLGVTVVGVAKGVERKPGLETLFLSNGPHKAPSEIHCSPDSPALHLIQSIRDEAHRFAITGHRKKRARVSVQSSLEDIDGIGAKRRRQLLQHFGGLQEVQSASVDELEKVPGISRHLAECIYRALH